MGQSMKCEGPNRLLEIHTNALRRKSPRKNMLMEIYMTFEGVTADKEKLSMSFRSGF